MFKASSLHIFSILTAICVASLSVSHTAIGAIATPDSPAYRSEEIIGGFDAAFATLDSLIFGEEGTPQRRLSAAGVLTGFGTSATPPISAELDSALREETEARIREGNARTGLQLTGQAYWRLAGNGGVDEVEGETGNGFYKAKTQVELRWYLLQSSLLGMKGREEEARLRERIARAGYEKERTDINDFRLKNFITEYHDSLLSGLIQRRLTLLTLLDDAQRHLLGGERISSDETVRALEARMEAERGLSAIEGSYPPAATLSGVSAMEVRVDSAALIRHVADAQGDMKILELRMELLEQQARNVKWWQELNVAPFIRYAHYFRRILPDSYNVDAGVTFTIPIDSRQSRKRATLRSGKAVLEAEMDRLSRRVADKTALIVGEVGKLNRTSRSEAARIAELKRYLWQRNDAYRRGMGEHNRLAHAREYAMYIAAMERLVEIQYRRDCLLADLQAMLPDETVLRFCTFVPIN